MRVLITGAASGFGRGVASDLATRGEDVVGLDIREAPGVITADVRNQAQVDKAVAEALSKLGGLDVLINNAGLGDPLDAALAPNDRAVATIETNLLGTWRVTSACMPSLVRTRGRVINVASGLAVIRVPFAAAYCASKSGLAAYSDVLRLEYGGGVGVTTVYPGYVRTPIHRTSEQMGLSLGAAVPEESLDSVVETIVGACYGRTRRDVATSSRTAAGIFFARHFPRSTDKVVGLHMKRLIRKGAFPRTGGGVVGMDRAG